MKPKIWCAVLLLLNTACNASGPADNLSSDAGQRAPSTQMSGLTDTEADLYYPSEKYLHFPLQIRDLIRRHEMENDHCRGVDPDEREKYRACNRRHRLLLELERHGWCWGGETGIGVDNHWRPCSEDPYYRNHLVSRELPFPEAE
jgi:hypothetical protein